VGMRARGSQWRKYLTVVVFRIDLNAERRARTYFVRHQQYRCQELVQRTGSGTSHDSDDGKIGSNAGRERSHFTVQARRRGREEAVLSRKGTLQRRRPPTWTEKSGSEPCQASSTGSETRSEEQGARIIFKTKLDGPITRNAAGSRRGV